MRSALEHLDSHSLQLRRGAAAALTCAVCGCTQVHLDQVQDGAMRLELGECPRCDHRWTRSLGGALRVSRRPVHVPEALPDAA